MKKLYIMLSVIMLGSASLINAMFTSLSRQGYRGARQVVRGAAARPSLGQRFNTYSSSGKESEAENKPSDISSTVYQTKSPSVRSFFTSQEVSLIEEAAPTFGFASWIPGTAESKAKKCVFLMNEVLDKMQKDGVTKEYIDQYRNLCREYMNLTGKDFNPIATKSLLLVNEAIKYLPYISADDDGLFSQIYILKQLYYLGVRVSPAEADDIIKKSGWDIRAKKLANMVGAIKYSEDVTIKDVGYVASLIASSYRMFQGFGVDITPYFGRTLNISDMQWLSDEFLTIKKNTNKNVFTGRKDHGVEEYNNARADIYPISYFNKNAVILSVHRNHFKDGYQLSKPDYDQYPTGYSMSHFLPSHSPANFVQSLQRENYGEFFLGKAQEAGFFTSGLEITVPTVDVVSSAARNTLIKELGLPGDASYDAIKNAFYEFSKKAAFDVTKDITGPLYIKLKTKINPAWDSYNAEVEIGKNKRLATE